MSVGSGFIAARTTISSPFETPASMPPARFDRATPVRADLVVRLRAAQPGEREAVADLDALHGLDPHQRRGEPRVEPVLAPRVRAEPRRDAARPHLDATAERVAVLARFVDRRGIRPRLGQRLPRHLDPDLAEERLRHGAGRDVDGRVPRRRTLERVADVREPVLLHAGEIRMARPRQRDRLRSLSLGLALGRPGAHPPRPVLVVAVADDERERRAERAPVAKAREHLDLVRLDLLARRAAVALLAAPEVGVDRGPVEDEPRRQARDDRDERRAVRLAGRCEVERHGGEPSGLAPARGPARPGSCAAAACAARRKRPSRPDSCGSSEIAAWASSPRQTLSRACCGSVR